MANISVNDLFYRKRPSKGMLMEPEASVSALVFHHPDCAYFTASEVARAGAGLAQVVPAAIE
jgi:hypothetical protein